MRNLKPIYLVLDNDLEPVGETSYMSLETAREVALRESTNNPLRAPHFVVEATPRYVTERPPQPEFTTVVAESFEGSGWYEGAGGVGL